METCWGSRTVLWHVEYATFFSADKWHSDFHGLWIMACRMSSSMFLSRTLLPVWGVVIPFSRSMLYHFTMSWCEGTWWQLYWHQKARSILATLVNFAYHTMHCARCCSVTTMFVHHALVPPCGWITCKPSTLKGRPSGSYSNKLLRDMCINLYTTVYYYNISNGSPCIKVLIYLELWLDVALACAAFHRHVPQCWGGEVFVLFLAAIGKLLICWNKIFLYKWYVVAGHSLIFLKK
jgi:hypothetical protein